MRKVPSKEMKSLLTKPSRGERIVHDGRHYVNVFTEHGGRVDGERGAGFIAG